MFKESMYPFHLEISNKVDLYQLNDGRYQLTADGPVEKMMIGHKYILLQNEIVDVLLDLGVERAVFEPATIWNRKTDTEYSDYQKMSVHRHFASSDLNGIDLDGTQFLVMDNHYLFVTPELKSALETTKLNLEFSEGFSNFG